MSDDPKAPEADDTDGPFDEKRAKEKIAKANSEAANLRKRLKELEPLADKAQKLEEASQSEVEKLQAKLTDAEKARDAATAKADRYEVALEKGLNLTRAKRLVGATRDELVADADELLADLGPADGKDRKDSKPPSGKPAEHLRGGGDPDTTPPTDVRKVVDSIPRGF
jgi:chromosome condensin MukBEF ATPase and DNA-binding subunit MukB